MILIGIDGLDPDILDRLMAAGRLPAFSRLREDGAYGPLRSREPLLSPLIWTTIATGRVPHDHGVLDFVELGRDGQAVPITGRWRRVPALWNLASEQGLSSGFVGWYATFPADEVEGFVVSDRLGFHQVKSAAAGRGATHPESLAGELRQRFGEAEVDVDATRSRFLNRGVEGLGPDDEVRLEELARIHASAEYYRRVFPALVREFRPALAGVYFELVDACGHLFMGDAPPRRDVVSEQEYRAFSGTVDRCYEYQDQVLAELVAAAGGNAVTFVLSDHGFKEGELRPRTSGRADTGMAGLWHRPDGALFMHGPGVSAGAAIEGATVLDMAPTVLALLAVPISDELPGRPLTELFERGALPEPSRLPRYDWQPQKHAVSAAADPAAIRKLRALGYLGDASVADFDERGRSARYHLNEGTSRWVDGDQEGALRAFSRAVRTDSRLVEALVAAARVYTQRGELDRAAPLLERALEQNRSSPLVRLGRAEWALRRGDWELAAAELRAAESLDDRLVRVHLLYARLENVTGRSREALARLQRAEGLSGSREVLAEVVLFRARVAAEAGLVGQAEAALARAARLVDDEELAAARGDLELARGRFAAAAGLFETAAAARQEDSGLERKLAQTLAATGRSAEAEAALLRAVAKASNSAEIEGAYGDLSLLLRQQDRGGELVALLASATQTTPDSSRLWGLLGAAYGERGELDLALRAYERSVELEPTPLGLKTLALLVLEQRGDRARAVRLWRRSLELDPGQPDVHAFLREHGAETP